MPNPRNEGPHRDLAHLPEGSRAVITAIPAHDGIAQDLISLRLLPGVEIEVVQVVPLGGPVLIRTGDSLYALGRAVAERVRVQP